jgi:hypothetical protein
MCKAVSVSIWLLWWVFQVFCIILVVHISPTKSGVINSHHQQSPMRMEGIRTTGCCPVPQRGLLRHCYHHLSAMLHSEMPHALATVCRLGGIVVSRLVTGPKVYGFGPGQGDGFF